MVVSQRAQIPIRLVFSSVSRARLGMPIPGHHRIDTVIRQIPLSFQDILCCPIDVCLPTLISRAPPIYSDGCYLDTLPAVNPLFD